MAERKIEEEKKSDGGQEFLTETAMKLVELSGEQAVFEFIGIRVREIVNDACVVANRYHPESEELEIVGVYGPPRSLLKKAAGLLGRDPVGMRFPIKGKDKEEMLEGRLRTGPKGIHDLTAGEMPKSVASALDKLLGVGKIYGMGFVSKGELFGNVTIICRKGNPAFDETTVETVTRMGALAIQREHGEGRFRAMVEKGSDVILLVDREFKITYTSPSFERIFGKQPAEFPELPIVEFFADYIHPEDLDATLEAYGKCLEKPGSECRAEFRFRHADGTWHYFVAVGINHLDTPSVNGLVINIRDITEHKKASVALRESEENLAITLNSIGDAVIATDVAGNVTRMNPVAEKLTGWNLAEALGKPLAEVFPIINAETRKPVENPVERVMKRGKVVGLANHTVLVSRGGKEHQIADSAAPIMDTRGKVRGVIMVFSDVTERYRSQERLRVSQERYHNLFENMNSAVAVYKPVEDGTDFEFIQVNEALESIEKIGREELIGKKVTHVFPGVEKFGLLDVLKRVNMTGEAESFPVTLYADDRIWGWRENYVYRLSSGEIVAIYEDVTQRKQHELEIENLNSFLLSIRNLNQMIVQESDFDKLLNESCRILTEIRGYIDVSVAFREKNADPIAPRAHFGSHERAFWSFSLDNGGEVPPCIQRILATRHAFVMESGDANCRDCTYCSHDMEHQSILVPMFGRDRTLMGVITACLEPGRAIHPQEVPLFEEVAGDLVFAYEKICNERTLEESEEKYHTLVESMQEGLWVIDENANTSFMNSSMARMLGYRVEEMLGKSMFDFMDEQDLALAHNNMARRRMGIKESHEFEFLKKDGSRIYVQMATSPLMGKGGEYKGAIAGVQNITERRRLEVELKRHNDSLLATTNAISEELAQVHKSMLKSERLAVLGQMAASVSHELRNPLSVINNIAYYLRTKIPDPDDKTLKMLEILEKEVERSDRIIGNMLTFSRRKPNLVETVNIKLLIKAYFADPDRVPGNIKLKLNLEDGMPTMVADEGKLIQVLDNLVTNAFHAMPDGGTLTVSAKAAKDFVEFSVRDTGHGMDADTMAHIFEPMFSTKTTGFGLGLPIVKTMVDDHDGNVTVASEPGVGTEFKVVLPRDGGAEK